MIFPFVKPVVVKTFDIANDPKIVTQLTAAQGQTSVIEQILLKNKNPKEVVATLKLAIQEEKRIQITDPSVIGMSGITEYYDTEIKYQTLEEGIIVNKYSNYIIPNYDNFFIKPNEFLMIQTDNEEQSITCFVTQIILNNINY